MSNDTMPIKTLYLVFLFGSAVVAHPTTKQCKGDKCNDRQVALTKQTLNALQTMNSRLQSIEGRLHSMESRQESIERQVKEDNGGKIKLHLCSKIVIKFTKYELL